MNREQTIEQCYQVPGQTWPVELGWLYDTIGNSKEHAEIGTYCGRSLLASCSGMRRGSSVLSVDNRSQWIHPNWVAAVQQATIDLMPSHVAVQKMNMHSVDAALECHRNGRKFNSIFIDGDHNYAECKADIFAWKELLKPGGLICGHDYWAKDVGVMDAVNEVFSGAHGVVSGTRIWFFRV